MLSSVRLVLIFQKFMAQEGGLDERHQDDTIIILKYKLSCSIIILVLFFQEKIFSRVLSQDERARRGREKRERERRER